MDFHAWFFVVLEYLVVLAVVPLDAMWRQRLTNRGVALTVRIPLVETAAILVWYAGLRIQPYLRGGDIYAFSLGVFDGITAMGLALPWLLHREKAAP